MDKGMIWQEAFMVFITVGTIVLGLAAIIVIILVVKELIK